ncbi:MAG: D-alanine--D-alanine ligase [Tannerella sp.]|jgi:D-alanine-D-alanine ligase|nr:D-alanine--D-alanine ligase [Tannerella sp.]
MKKNVAIIAGGYSSEYEVSIRSAQNLYTFVDKALYNVYILIIEKDKWYVRFPDSQTAPVDKNDFSFQDKNNRVKIDYAYITIHGTPGENGFLQGYLEMLHIPYSSCNTLTSALTFNKYTCNQFLKAKGILVADSIRLRHGEPVNENEIIARLGLPVFVKPNESGSSFGATRVKETSEIRTAVEKAFLEGNEVLIERFISGTEVTCGCYKTCGEVVVFPVTEIVTTNDFFDYSAKYMGEVQEITPARIPDEVTKCIRRETAEIYEIIDAKGIIRIDYIIPPDKTPVLLEVNTTPGMTGTSFIPQQVKAAGLDMKNVMTNIIENR